MIIEAETSNVTLVNCFTHRFVNQTPSEPLSFLVVAWVKDGQGEMTLELVIEQADDFEEVFRIPLSLRLDSPLREARCRFRVRNCRFPVAGAYQVTLLADGEPIAQRRLTIFTRESEP